MSANYKATSERVFGGEQRFSCCFPVNDDYGVSEATWAVYEVSGEWWLQGNYGGCGNSFARFVGVPDLERAKVKAPAPDRVLSDCCAALVPNPADYQCDSESAEELFGCGLDKETYEHNAF